MFSRFASVKAGQGTGKTLFCKKNACNWAKGIFTKFDFVFVVFCDVIGSFRSIEDAILQQYGTNDSQIESLGHILDELATKCLVIFDDLHQSIPGYSLSRVTILATEDLLKSDRNYSYTCEIQGFIKSDAKSLITSNKGRGKVIVHSTPEFPLDCRTSKNYNPMLVMFLCVLDHNRRNENNNLSVCDIYLKLAMHLCKHSSETFCNYVRPLGKLAFENFQHGVKLCRQAVVSFQDFDILVTQLV